MNSYDHRILALQQNLETSCQNAFLFIFIMKNFSAKEEIP